MGSDDFDLRAIVKHLTPTNVAKWIAVISFGALAIIVLSWLAVFLWSAS